jgi:EAL domain-containing protein (putative c-di-GMP-specific phosphodiesterase class I)
MPDVDRVVLTAALAHLAQLPDALFVSVNVSPQALAKPGYAEDVIALVAEAAVDPSRLHLEVTETSLFGVSPTNVATMQQIADAGIKWYVDDFGTGYSSISHLQNLPISGLKLDLSFSQGLITGNRRSLRLTQALAGLSMGLDLDTVAEGVSDRAQAAILWGQGWRRGQGWLFGRAEPGGQSMGQSVGVRDPGSPG